MFGLGHTEIIVIFLALLLIFGGKKLPELARGLGKGIREFKKATNELEKDVDVSGEIEDNSSSQNQHKYSSVYEYSSLCPVVLKLTNNSRSSVHIRFRN